MSIHIPRSKFSQDQRSSNRGFTLIELLVVIAIVMILAGITFGVARGVKVAQARTQAKAELAVLAQGIEQFKLRYGDYPWHSSSEADTNKMLLYALTGRLVMTATTEKDRGGNEYTVIKVDINTNQDSEEVKNRPKFIDESVFQVEDDNILDPWGRPYLYWYKWSRTPDNWEVMGYHLYSSGPNGDDANAALKLAMESEASGVFTEDYRDVADENAIIFVGE